MNENVDDKYSEFNVALGLYDCNLIYCGKFELYNIEFRRFNGVDILMISNDMIPKLVCM